MSSDSADSPHAAPNGAPTILLVENDSLVTPVMAEALSDAGYRSICVTTIDEAWEALQSGPVDVVVSDLHLGADLRSDEFADALTLLARIRADPAHRAIPFIVASGNRRKDTIQLAMNAGAADYLIKPFPPSELLAGIRQCLTAK